MKPGLGVLIPAAGSGDRMGGVRKAFLDLDGEPLLQRALAVFLEHPRTHAVVVALPADEAQTPPAWLTELDPRINVVAGGSTRTESVATALAALSAEAGLVAVHDGARPFVDRIVLDGLLRHAEAGFGAVPGYPAVDTLKRVGPDGSVVETVDRTSHWQVQTPQLFPRDLLERAYRQAEASGTVATDDAALVERIGGSVKVVQGSPYNLKVTWPADLALARVILTSVSDPGVRP